MYIRLRHHNRLCISRCTSDSYVGWGGGGAGEGTTGVNGDPTNNPFTTNAPANSGGGAHGVTTNFSASSSSGGSGVVVIRYPGTVAKATGGTITYVTVGGTAYVIHTFIGSNTFTVL